MRTNYNPFSLEGKTILVTGASSGIGKCIAIECSRLGANLILNARDIDRLNDTRQQLDEGQHNIIAGDLTLDSDIEMLMEKLPSLDGVVLCAGKGKNIPVQYCNRTHLDDIFNLNFFSTVELVRLLYKKKKLLKGSSVVFISSVGGLTEFAPGSAIYGATKAALNSFMKYCAREFSPRKIRVNSVCPGMINTPLIHRGTITEQQLEEDAKKYPCGRYGEPEDVAYGVIYLLSNASSWITGSSLFIDGGLSII